MSAVILRQLPGASTAFRSAELATLAGSPLQHGADLILPLTIATAAGFGLFILMLAAGLDLAGPAGRGGAVAHGGGAGHRGAQTEPARRGPDAARGVRGASASGGDGPVGVGNPV